MNVPAQIFGNEAGIAARLAAEVERFDGLCVHQHVDEVAMVEHRHAVRVKARDGARRVAREAANVERHFVVEETDVAAHDRPVAFER